MWPMFLVAFLAAVIIDLMPSTERSQGDRVEPAAIVARQMLVQHSAALQVCGVSLAACGAGTVNVTPKLPSIAQGAPAYDGTHYRTVSNGAGLIVTVWLEDVAAAKGNEGTIAAALAGDHMNQYTSGLYDYANQRIGYPVAAGTFNGTRSGSYSNGLSVPRTVGGVTLRDAMPIVATNLTP